MKWLYNLPSSTTPKLLQALKKIYGLSGEDSVSTWIAAYKGKVVGDPVVPPKSPFTLAQLKKMNLMGVYEDEG